MLEILYLWQKDYEYADFIKTLKLKDEAGASSFCRDMSRSLVKFLSGYSLGPS